VHTDAFATKDINEGKDKEEPGFAMDITVLDVELPELIWLGHGMVAANPSNTIFSGKTSFL
jgi:hypothetical protein